MAQFEYAIGTVLKHEGGFVNNLYDPGGATNYGISLKFLKSQKLLDGDFDHNGYVDINDIKSMKVNDAINVYLKLWKIYGYDRIVDNNVAVKLFDMSVNMGQRQAVLLAQNACKTLDCDAELFIDGILGVYTVEAINKIKPSILIDRLRENCKQFYLSLIGKNPSLSEFKEGWLNRAAS